MRVVTERDGETLLYHLHLPDGKITSLMFGEAVRLRDELIKALKGDPKCYKPHPPQGGECPSE